MNLLIIITLVSISSSSAYNILGVFHAPSRSHGHLAKGIVDSLLDAGHKVTWVSPFTDWKPHKNLKLIDASATLSVSGQLNMLEMRDIPHSFLKEFAANISATGLESPGLRDALLKESFDAVITEWFFSDTDAGYAAVLQVPWVLLSGMVLHPHTEGLLEDVRSIPTIPLMMLNYPLPMNFVQRVANTLMFALMQFQTIIDWPSTSSRYEAQFAPLAAARGVRLPPLSAALYNVSIMLINSHPAIAPALSLPPNAVEIAGYHISEAEPLPQDIKQILDNSPRGVVYFSMGSVVKSALIPAHTRQALIAMLGAIPHTVLWKFEEELQGLPKNIIVRKWWPQAGVLAHPNVKLFITHGGLLSTLEAVHYGVPLLAVPVFGDQPSNAARAVSAGYARQVPYSDHMAPELKKELNHMLADDRYYKQAKYLSKLFNKRPVHPSKLISHYVELAIESKGAYHLRSKSHLYAWYERYMLDQLAALIALLYVIYIALKRLFRLCSKSKGGKKVKKN